MLPEENERIVSSTMIENDEHCEYNLRPRTFDDI